MNRPTKSTIAYVTTVAAAAVAAATMTTSALATAPTVHTPFVGTRTAAEVRAEVISQREAIRNSATEWAMQQNEPRQFKSTYSRDKARAEYIAARQQVHAMNSEHSGDPRIEPAPSSTRDTVMATNASQ